MQFGFVNQMWKLHRMNVSKMPFSFKKEPSSFSTLGTQVQRASRVFGLNVIKFIASKKVHVEQLWLPK